jgi:hypothetical protein
VGHKIGTMTDDMIPVSGGTHQRTRGRTDCRDGAGKIVSRAMNSSVQAHKLLPGGILPNLSGDLSVRPIFRAAASFAI